MKDTLLICYADTSQMCSFVNC